MRPRASGQSSRARANAARLSNTVYNAARSWANPILKKLQGPTPHSHFGRRAPVPSRAFEAFVDGGQSGPYAELGAKSPEAWLGAGFSDGALVLASALPRLSLLQGEAVASRAVWGV